MKLSNSDIIKASNKGNREADLEDNFGKTKLTKVHKSQKKYTRKIKYKNW